MKRRRTNFLKSLTNNSATRFAKSTSKKYMPKLKHKLEDVGSNVIQSTRKFIGSFKTKRRHRHQRSKRRRR
jgi:hypothetical protein